MLSTIAFAAVAVMAPAVAAITVPGGSDPTAGAVYSPDSTSTVTAGQAFEVVWEATTTGCGSTVDLALLYGPSSSDMNAISYIVQSISNNGSYYWNPSTSLKPTDGTYMYGIELICDSTQAYQYTSRFSLANPSYSASEDVSSSASSSMISTTTATTLATTTASTTVYSSSATAKYPSSNSTASAGPTAAVGTGSASASKTASHTGKKTSEAATATATTSAASGTGASKSSSTSSSIPVQATGAASNVKVGFGGIVAAAAVAMVAL